MVKTSSDPSASASFLNSAVNINNGYTTVNGMEPSKVSVPDIVEIDVPSSAGNFMKSSSPVGVSDSVDELLCLMLELIKLFSL